MKKFTIIIALLLIQFNTLFAGNDNVAPAPNSGISSILMTSLAPVTPKEATFEEVAAPDFSSLAPVVPAEASFEDSIENTDPDFKSLAPELPIEADFE